MQPRIVVIEGVAGGLGINLLFPEITKLAQKLKDNPQIRFYGTELNTHKVTSKGKEILQALTSLGMILVNKSDAVGAELYASLQPDYVFVGTPPHTHIGLVRKWLQRVHPPKVILVEKPFSEDIEETRKFVEFLQRNPTLESKVYAYDFADDNFNLSGKGLREVQDYLGPLSEMIFFWLQDHSGADRSSYLLAGDDHPISRENRIAVLADEKRMVFDALTHFFNPIGDLVDLTNAKVIDIKAAQYENAEIKGETFVASRVILHNKLPPSLPIIATIYAGKGVGNVKTLGINRVAHMLILRNKAGKEVRLSIDDVVAYFIDNTKKVEKRIPLTKLYARTMKNLFFGNAGFGRTPQYALRCLEILDQIRNKINSHLKKENLETYRLGTNQVSAPSLEEILQKTTRVYGTGQDMLRGEELTDLIPHPNLKLTP